MAPTGGNVEVVATRPGSSASTPPSPFRLAVVLLTALVVAVATTRASVYVGPSAFALFSAAALAAATVAASWRRTAIVAGVVAVVLGVLSGHVLWRAGMPRVHDLMHVWGVWAYGRCVLEGVVYPQWIPYLGAGMPLLEFYGPLNFLLALPGILAGLSPVAAWKLELILGHGLSALSMLVAARMLGAGRRGALVAAVAGAFAPWRLCVFDYRGAIGEANAFVFLPLVAGATLSLARTPRLRTALVLAGAVAGLALTHVHSLFTLLVTLAVTLAVTEVISPTPHRVRRFAALAGTLCLAAGLSAGWWVPVAAEARYTTIRQTTEDNPNYAYADNGVSPASLLERRKWDRVRVSIPRSQRRSRGPEGQQMPFYTGALLLLGGLTAGWWSGRREAWGLAAGAFVGLALSTAALAGASAVLPGVATLRFPWRFLSPASVLAGLALALGIDAWSRAGRDIPRLVPLVALVLGLVWDAAPYTGAADRIPPYEGVVHWYSEENAWTHWDTSMHPVPFEVPAAESASVAAVRVRNLALPPSGYTTGLDSFYPAYYEWLTPDVYRYWKALDPRMMIQAGVRYGFSEVRREPVVWPARPYVELRSPDAPPGDRTARTLVRLPGRLRIKADCGAAASTLLVREQFFPGWRARVDDGPWHAPGRSAGFVTVDLAAGRHTVELRYGATTPARRVGLAISLATLLSATVLIGMRKRIAPFVFGG